MLPIGESQPVRSSRPLDAGRAGATLLITALVVLVFVIVDFSAGRSRYDMLEAQSSRAHEVVDAAENALSDLKDTETGQRGYIITENPAYLTPYQTGVRAWSASFGDLKKLVVNDPVLAPLVEQLGAAGKSKLEELDETVRAAHLRREAAIERVEQGSGKRYMDEARRADAQIVRREEAEYARFEALSRETETRTRWSVEVAAAALFLFTLAGTLLLEREIRTERLLAAGLESSERKYRDLAGSLEQQVRQRTRELEQTNEELQAFTWSVSHDLRAPLRAIDGFSHMLIEDHAGSIGPGGEELISRIRAGAKRMSQLIHSLLDLSRVGRVELHKESVSISDLAESVIDGLRNSDPGRAVQVAIEPGLTAQGDPNLLRIVLDNLLANAWKFTSRTPAPRIEVGEHIRNGRREYFVRDNGAGFNTEYADKLFKPFQRLHSESEFEGTGIGLATAQRVLRRHGGAIRAESNNKDGATFYFTL